MVEERLTDVQRAAIENALEVHKLDYYDFYVGVFPNKLYVSLNKLSYEDAIIMIKELNELVSNWVVVLNLCCTIIIIGVIISIFF